MRARRFPAATDIFSLPGGTEDNDLWVERGTTDDGIPFLRSLWVPTAKERRKIAEGHNLTLYVLGNGTPPIAIAVTDEQPGKAER